VPLQLSLPRALCFAYKIVFHLPSRSSLLHPSGLLLLEPSRPLSSSSSVDLPSHLVLWWKFFCSHS
jgi:hypothetical protein